MLPDRVSNPGPLTYESGALPIALRGPAIRQWTIRSVFTCSLVRKLVTVTVDGGTFRGSNSNVYSFPPFSIRVNC